MEFLAKCPSTTLNDGQQASFAGLEQEQRMRKKFGTGTGFLLKTVRGERLMQTSRLQWYRTGNAEQIQYKSLFHIRWELSPDKFHTSHRLLGVKLASSVLPVVPPPISQNVFAIYFLFPLIIFILSIFCIF